ncbi:MAG: methionine adenosyltransferase [Saccharofermentanales bacterium]|jgi:S-adenosylmethionine synthetase|nr:methionine adenosyltransferase [Bacillota bacterium]
MKDNRVWLFTSESVTEGHPDKLCDQVADAVLDAILENDPMARVACETVATTGLIMVMGEISTTAYVDIAQIARNTVRDIGYTRDKGGFDADSCAVVISIDEQSPDISMGVNQALEYREEQEETYSTGAGDQGLMFGYANRDTAELMPLPIVLAHRLTKRLAEVRKSAFSDILYPDGKAQVTVAYCGDQPVHIDTVVVSTQHAERVTPSALEGLVIEEVIKPSLPADLFDADTKIYINPTGRFVIGGPQGDTGLTGRKIICDTYGGFAHHGGGAFSGKDPTKVDRSASYAARHVAKNIVAAELASACEVQIAYAIGMANPISINVRSFGTGVVSDQLLSSYVEELFDLRPEAIIRSFNLRRPIYRQISNYGHFGRNDLDLPWERTEYADRLRALAVRDQ